METEKDITLVPYYPNEAVTFAWYQDRELCKLADNVEEPYSMEKLKKMYQYLSTHGDCFYIDYQGTLVGDITLQESGEISIVICKEYQNRHIGRNSVLKLLELARKKGMRSVKANIYAFNEQSRRLFTALGFRETEAERFELQL